VAAKAELAAVAAELAMVVEQVDPALVPEAPRPLYPDKLVGQVELAEQIPAVAAAAASKFHQLADLADLELLLLGTADKILLSSCC
jgi:hypothetical protein